MNRRMNAALTNFLNVKFDQPDALAKCDGLQAEARAMVSAMNLPDWLIDSYSEGTSEEQDEDSEDEDEF